MENKNGSGHGAGSLGGKGFYIVLFLCAAVIGVSLWIMLTDAGTNVEDVMAEEPVVDVSGAFVTMIPADEGMRTEQEQQQEAQPAADASGAEDGGQTPAEENASQQEEPPAQEVFSETVTSYVWPVRGTVQTPYSVEKLLYDNTMADWRTHDGVDIAAIVGTAVMAPAGGTVTDIYQDDLMGTTVVILHANEVMSTCSNLEKVPTVEIGDTVRTGDVIGSVGKTAIAESGMGSHLHLSMTKAGVREIII